MADIDNQYEPLAVAGYKSSGGLVDDDYLPELRNERGRRTIRQMTNDETIGSFMLALSSIYTGLEWYTDPTDPDDTQAVELSEWMHDALHDQMGDPRGAQPDDTWGAFVQTFADVDAFGWGYYDVWVKDLPDGTVGVARLMPVTPETLYDWDIDPDGHVTALNQQSPRDYKIRKIPTNRAIHLVSQTYKGSPEGKSLFRTAYRMWYYKKIALEIEMILHERGAGFPVMYVHADVVRQSKEVGSDGKPTARARLALDAMNNYKSMVRDIKRNQQAGAVVYFDTVKDVDADGAITNTDTKTVELKLETPGASTTNDIDVTIKRLDSALARAMLADFLMFNTAGGGGQSGGLTSRVDLFIQVLTGLLETKVETINRQLIPQLWKLNSFPDDKMPRVRAGSIERENVHKIIESLERMSRAGFAVGGDDELQEHLYKEMGAPTSGMARDVPPLSELDD